MFDMMTDNEIGTMLFVFGLVCFSVGGVIGWCACLWAVMTAPRLPTDDVQTEIKSGWNEL